MKPCDDNRLRISLYLDDELRDQELKDFEAHLGACPGCREAVAGERRFLDDVRSAGPLYSAPAELRSRVEKIVREAPVYNPPPQLRARVQEMIERTISKRPRFRWLMPQAAGAFALLAAITGGLWLGRQATRNSTPHSEFETMAVEMHKRHLSGKLPLEMVSSSPAAISAWFKGRVQFQVTLPSYDEMPRTELPYQYEGARLVSYRNDPAAYVAYQVGGKPATLIALPTSQAPPLHGRGVVMGKLTIFYDSLDGFHVITWSGPRSRLTYALITDLEHPSQACIICHASPTAKDRDLMRRLNQQ